MKKQDIENAVESLNIPAKKVQDALDILLELHQKLGLDDYWANSNRPVVAEDIIAQTIAILKIKNL